MRLQERIKNAIDTWVKKVSDNPLSTGQRLHGSQSDGD